MEKNVRKGKFLHLAKTQGFSTNEENVFIFKFFNISSPKMGLRVPENLTLLFEFNQLVVTWEMRWTRSASQKLRELRVSILVTENYSGDLNSEHLNKGNI